MQVGQELALPVRINSMGPFFVVTRIESNTSVVATEIGEQILHLRSSFGSDVPYNGPCSINCLSFEVAGRQAKAELLPVNLAIASYDAGTQLDGILGNNVLHQFVVTIDSRNGFIKLEPFR